jgi:hypothetical protein
MQNLAQKDINLKSKLKLFEQSFKSEETRRAYTCYLNKHLQFPGSLKITDFNHRAEPRKIEDHIINFTISMKEKGKIFSTIHNYVSAIIKFYTINDVVLNTTKISRFIPDKRKSKKDRAYKHRDSFLIRHCR